MPRPGPRPYECVRRAWHSDRHQPVRGSLIQEIFRLANEVHSPATLTNREWLEKLPLVVLKAEEIIYSKANSEAEYMDPKTVWDRTNDAIDTIIRRDDASQTQTEIQTEPEPGLLHPCIEAALNLGCVPRRASRSQRHNDPVCYLSSPDKPARDIEFLMSNPNASPLESWYSALMAGNKLNHSGSSVDSGVLEGSFELRDWVFSCPEVGRVCPLHYAEEKNKGHDPDPSSVSEIGVLHNFIGSDMAKGGNGLILGEIRKNTANNDCDLSLRLGLFSPSSMDTESGWAHEVDDVGSSSSCNGSKYSDTSPSGTRLVNF